MTTRYFVLLGDRTPEEAMDRAERHGPVVAASFHRSPAGEAVYGWVEVSAPEERRLDAREVPPWG
jgi:hypothetical protein